MELSDTKSIVHYVQRRPRALANYSVEVLFDVVRAHLSASCETQVYIVPVESTGVLPRLRILAYSMLRQGPVTHITGDITFAALAMRSRGTVITILDCGDGQRSALGKVLYDLLWLTLPARRAAVVTTISEFTRRELIARTGVNSAKVIVIPCCASPRFSWQPKEFNSREPEILLVGTSPNKNVGRILAALVELRCRVHIIGELTPEQQAFLVNHQMSFRNSVNVPIDAVVQAYAAADLVCFASTYEGFGLPIIEAQMVGRAVVTSNTSAMPEVAGDAAVLVDPFDVAAIRNGVRRLIEEPRYREALIRRGLENAARFAPTRIAGMYEEVYTRALASG